MSSEAVRAIVEQKLQLEWGSQTPITWDNVDRNVFPGVDFIACSLTMPFSEPKGMKCQRETHLFIIEVYTKHGTGIETNMERTAQLCSAFFGFMQGYLRVSSVRDERVGDIRERHQRNVLIEIKYDEHF